jgi:hypothetical protein
MIRELIFARNLVQYDVYRHQRQLPRYVALYLPKERHHLLAMMRGRERPIKITLLEGAFAECSGEFMHFLSEAEREFQIEYNYVEL